MCHFASPLPVQLQSTMQINQFKGHRFEFLKNQSHGKVEAKKLGNHFTI
jgi:hypothetical protein